jgi:hypothetical protein
MDLFGWAEGPSGNIMPPQTNPAEAAKCQSARRSNGTWMWIAKRNELKDDLTGFERIRF